MSDPARTRTGFTLIELVLVIGLILTVTALAVPRFKRTFADLELKNAAFSIYKMVQLARERALAEGRVFRIRFRFKYGDYQLLQGPDLKPAEGRLGRRVRLSDRLKLEGRQADLSCYPDGNCDPVRIQVSADENAYEISLENAGGVAKIREVVR